MIWTSIASWWANSKTVQLITYVLLFLIGAKAVMESIKHAAKKAERAANAQRNAEEYARTVQTSSQVKEELHAKVDEARENAADLPVYPDADSLRNDRPDLAAIVFGNSPRNGG